MNIVQANKLTCIPMGRQGESKARTISFDISYWVEEFGVGHAQLIYQRNREESPYLVPIEIDEMHVLWEPTNTDTFYATIEGECEGECELRYYIDDTIVKSRTWKTFVEPSMTTPTDETPDEPFVGWFEQVIGSANGIDDIKNEAVSARIGAELAQQKAEESASSAFIYQENANNAQNAVMQAKEDAVMAATSSEQAAQRAMDAQQLAESAKEASLLAKSDAESAAVDARESKLSAQSASTAASDAKDAAVQAMHSAESHASTASNAAAIAVEAKEESVSAKSDAVMAKNVAVEAADRAETASIKQPYPNATTQTWFVWNASIGQYEDTGVSSLGLTGNNGSDGADGKDGVSISHRWNGTTLEISSASGTTSADLKGDRGAPGVDGSDGISVTHEWDGTVLSVTSASGTTSADLKGEKGDAFTYDDFTAEQIESIRGPKGFDGQDGNPGVYCGETEPVGDFTVWINPNGDNNYNPHLSPSWGTIEGDLYTQTDLAAVLQNIESAISLLASLKKSPIADDDDILFSDHGGDLFYII